MTSQVVNKKRTGKRYKAILLDTCVDSCAFALKTSLHQSAHTQHPYVCLKRWQRTIRPKAWQQKKNHKCLMQTFSQSLTKAKDTL